VDLTVETIRPFMRIAKALVFNARTPFRVQRRFVDAMATLVKPPPDVTMQGLVLDGIQQLTATPRGVQPHRAVLHLHGGGYVAGSASSHAALLGELARTTRSQVVAPDYRLAPEHPYPAALDDAEHCYHHLLKRFSAQQIVLMGVSAGGGLGLATLLRLRERRYPLPRAFVAVSPWVDLSLSGSSNRANAKTDAVLSHAWLSRAAAAYAGFRDPREISPLFADFTHLPPTLIQVSEEELLKDDSVRLEHHLSRDGVSVTLRLWPGVWHAWIVTTNVPAAREGLREIAEFVESQFTPAPSTAPAHHPGPAL